MEAPQLITTKYSRADCQIGVVHVGYGAFHRAHQAVFIDDYMEQTGDLRWGIAAVNLRASESDAFAKAAAANDAYLLKYTGNRTPTAWRLVRSHLQFADWAQDAAAAEMLVALESVHAITMTVTEGGYCRDSHGKLDLEDSKISAEMNGGKGSSVFAYLRGALRRRYDTTQQRISVLCCDNIRGNGHMLETTFLAYLEAVGEMELATWVRNNVTFPCSMVDRITPRTSMALIKEAESLFPDCSVSPIHSEDYIQWVIEDRFAGPMPDLGRVGVEIVANVDPYEEAKIRILNGGHSALAYLGVLAGHATFDEAVRDQGLREHFERVEKDEVLPGLAINLPFDKLAYCERITERFANSAVADALERICMDGFTKIPIFLRPTIEGCLEQKIIPKYCYLSVASWYVFAQRHADKKISIPYHETNLHLLAPLLENGREVEFASSTYLWADLPIRFTGFVEDIVQSIQEVDQKWPA